MSLFHHFDTIKIRFDFEVLDAVHLPPSWNGEKLAIMWKRDRLRKGRTKSSLASGNKAVFNENFALTTEMKQESKTKECKEKSIPFYLRRGSKREAKVYLDLAPYFQHGSVGEVTLPFSKEEFPPTLRLRVRTTWLKFNKKKIQFTVDHQMEFVSDGEDPTALSQASQDDMSDWNDDDDTQFGDTLTLAESDEGGIVRLKDHPKDQRSPTASPRGSGRSIQVPTLPLSPRTNDQSITALHSPERRHSSDSLTSKLSPRSNRPTAVYNLNPVTTEPGQLQQLIREKDLLIQGLNKTIDDEKHNAENIRAEYDREKKLMEHSIDHLKKQWQLETDVSNQLRADLKTVMQYYEGAEVDILDRIEQIKRSRNEQEVQLQKDKREEEEEEREKRLKAKREKDALNRKIGTLTEENEELRSQLEEKEKQLSTLKKQPPIMRMLKKDGKWTEEAYVLGAILVALFSLLLLFIVKRNK